MSAGHKQLPKGDGLMPKASAESLGRIFMIVAGLGVLASIGAYVTDPKRFAFSWLGTSYLWGGTTRSGIDCSGFLREMFRTVYNVELPRTTRDQINLGREVRIDFRDLGKNFEPGDLFFYVDSTGTPNHVVTYIGQGQFTHSAGGRGVVIDGWKALWGRRIVGRRVLVPAREGGTVDDGPIPALAPFRDLLAGNEPLCGRLNQDKLELLYGDEKARAASAVLLPLPGIGMLTVGSADANRFFPGMGTLFLRLTAESLATGLGRYPQA